MSNFQKIYEYFTSFQKEKFIEFYINNILCGYLKEDFYTVLEQNFSYDFTRVGHKVFLSNKYSNFQEISLFFENLGNVLHSMKYLELRGEYMPLLSYYESKLIAKIDRRLTNYFGTLSEGIHVNGYVKTHSGLHLWISKRSPLIIDPNCYDNMVAGGVSFGYSIVETLFKECFEEAKIPAEIVTNFTWGYKFRYTLERYAGVRNDLVHSFNIEIPHTFIPEALDGEVSNFYLMSLDEVYNLLKNNDNIKFNSFLVIASFLMNNSNFLSSVERKIIKALAYSS